LDVLKNNIKTSPSSGKSAGSSKDGVRVVIEKLEIVHAAVTPAIAGRGKSIALPEIVMTNIGSESSPATTAQVAQEIMSRVIAVSSAMVMKSGLSSIPAGSGTLQKAGGALKGLFSK
ncbi:MAG: hypothetical protein KGL10_01765, partial [Alphaproteobacteria bacterium]|nr:hypothetical protein [Alphaproteobacteria bacterium]